MVCGVARHREVAFEVHADYRIPLFFARGEEHAVADEARVVDQHVELTEGVDRGLHEAVRALPVGDVVGVRDGFAAERVDLVDDVLCGSGATPAAVERDAEVVHDDSCALAGESECVLAADAAPGARDDDDAALTDPGHGAAP